MFKVESTIFEPVLNESSIPPHNKANNGIDAPLQIEAIVPTVINI